MNTKRPDAGVAPSARHDNEEYRVYFSRRTATDCVESTHYEIVIDTDGSFAARRSDTGYIIAGYNSLMPESTIEEAAASVFARGTSRTLHIRGNFTDAMRLIIEQYYGTRRIGTCKTVDFPTGRIQPDE